MKTVLLVDRDRRTCREIRSVPASRHKVVAVHTPSAAFKSLKKYRAEAVLVKTATGDGDAIALLEDFRENDIRVPRVAGGRGTPQSPFR